MSAIARAALRLKGAPCCLALACAFGPGAAPEALGNPAFRLPLQCTPNRDCWVANHFDHDPGRGARDYMCGARSYDGHDGTDFAVRDLAAMRAGVVVAAAAAGTVRAVRDGIADTGFPREASDPPAGRECGNGVVIAHPDGWETQYCHLRAGSLRVRPGQGVAAGEALGQVGLSGRTEFPHLHFTVRHLGQARDPFAGAASDPACAPPTTSLWHPDTAAALPYSRGAIFNLGIAPGEPTTQAIRDGTYARSDAAAFAGDSPALALFIEVFGLVPGDTLRLRLDGPDGTPVAQREIRFDAPLARWTGFVGRRRPAGGWPAGTYSGQAVLTGADQGRPPARAASIEFTVR